MDPYNAPELEKYKKKYFRNCIQRTKKEIFCGR